MLKVTISLALLASIAWAQQCYFPDGTKSADVPCNGSAIHSACCSSTAYCLSNGLCLNDAVTSRGSCTDKSWASDSCVQYCRDSNPSGGYALMACSSTTFTCGFYPDNCGTSSTFTIENAGGIVLRDAQLANAMQAADISEGPVASAIASSTSIPSNDDNNNNEGDENADFGDKEYSATSMIILGVVMAVGFLTIIAGLVFLLLRERKLRFKVQNQAEKDSQILLHPSAFSSHHTQPTYAHYGSPAYDPQQRSEVFGNGHCAPQEPARVELDNVHVNELDSRDVK